LVCFAALLISPCRREYRITGLYLLLAFLATAVFRPESSWLHNWYIWIDTPVVILRFAAALECLHRQTERYPEWWVMMGASTACT
jgi:hypothetical protein